MILVFEVLFPSLSDCSVKCKWTLIWQEIIKAVTSSLWGGGGDYIIFLKFSTASFTFSSSVWLWRSCTEKKIIYLPGPGVVDRRHIVRVINVAHLLRILLLHLQRHLLLVVVLHHLLPQFLQLFLQVSSPRHQFCNFLLHVNQTLERSSGRQSTKTTVSPSTTSIMVVLW